MTYSSSDDDNNVERLDKYKWHQTEDGEPYVEETYEVHWTDPKMVTRENIHNENIGSGVLLRYWTEVINAVKEHADMIERNEQFAETQKMHNHRTSYENAQTLLDSKFFHSLPQIIEHKPKRLSNTPPENEETINLVLLAGLKTLEELDKLCETLSRTEQEVKEISQIVNEMNETNVATPKQQKQKAATKKARRFQTSPVPLCEMEDDPLTEPRIATSKKQKQKVPAKKAKKSSSSSKKVSLPPVLQIDEFEEDEEFEEEPGMEEQDQVWKVEKVENYKWTEKKINGKREIEQTYEVFWVGYTERTREKASDISPDNIAHFWQLVKESLDQYKELKERGELFAETKQACMYRKAFEAAEKLRKRNLPGVVVPDTEGGDVGDCMVLQVLPPTEPEEVPPTPEESWVEKYEWEQVDGLHGTKNIIQTYMVHWTCGKLPTRELCMNIHAKHITEYWQSVKEIVKNYEDMIEREESFAETERMYNAMKAHKAAEDLRSRNLPYIYLPEMHGKSGNYLKSVIERLDKKIAEKKKKPMKRRR